MIKKMEIQSRLIPTLLYGAELWGEARDPLSCCHQHSHPDIIQQMDQIINKAILWTMKSTIPIITTTDNNNNNAVQIRALQRELDIPSISHLISLLIWRSWNKFPTLNTWIEKIQKKEKTMMIIPSPLSNEGRAKRFITITTLFSLNGVYKRNCIEEQQEQEGNHCPHDKNSNNSNNNNGISQWKRAATIGKKRKYYYYNHYYSNSTTTTTNRNNNNRMFLKRISWASIAMKYPKLQDGFQSLIKLRASIFGLGPQLVESGILPSSYHDTCPCCNDDREGEERVGIRCPETAIHLILHCTRWLSQRRASGLINADPNVITTLIRGEQEERRGEIDIAISATLPTIKEQGEQESQSNNGNNRRRNDDNRPIWLRLIIYLQSISRERHLIISSLLNQDHQPQQDREISPPSPSPMALERREQQQQQQQEEREQSQRKQKKKKKKKKTFISNDTITNISGNPRGEPPPPPPPLLPLIPLERKKGKKKRGKKRKREEKREKVINDDNIVVNLPPLPSPLFI
jgi:hypothetical protein